MKKEKMYLVRTLALTALSSALFAQQAGASDVVTIDFETDQSGSSLEHGQSVDDGFDFADATPEFNFSNGLVRISSVGIADQSSASNRQDGHLGAAIFNSNLTTGPDPDLRVGSGNILILQSDGNSDLDNVTLETNRSQNIDHDNLIASGDGRTSALGGGFVFLNPDDSADAFNDAPGQPSGGTILFEFAQSVQVLSLDVIDIDSGVEAQVILTDQAGGTRTYSFGGFTLDINDLSSPEPGDGIETLDLTSLLAQDSEDGAAGEASVVIETTGFDPFATVQLEVLFSGPSPSGAIDNLSFVVPEPSSLALLGLSGLMMIKRRRRG